MATIKRGHYSPAETAILTGIGIDALYARVRQDNAVYEIPVIRNGRCWTMPAGRLNQALGITWRDANDILDAAKPAESQAA